MPLVQGGAALFPINFFQYIGSMKFLHTGDLHLGKTFYERSLIQDQQHLLEQLTQELTSDSANPYQALVIAGDVYDRAVPSPEAVELFGSFLTSLRQTMPQLHIVIISGNHDSPSRLAFASQLLKHQNIHIATSNQDMTNPIIIDHVALYPLAFMNPNFLGDGQTHQQQMAQSAIAQILDYHQTHHPRLAKVLAAHLFTQGGTSCDSERVFVGTAELVEGSLLSRFDYVALGHLHRCQNPGGTNIWYSGSPLAYSFSETGNENCFLQVELQPGQQAAVTRIPVTPLHPVHRLEGSFEEFYRDQEGRYRQYRDSYLEISSTDATLKENPMDLLRSQYPLLLSYRQDRAVANSSSGTMEERRQLIQQVGESSLPTAEIFEAFMKDIYQQLPPDFPEELELFNQILEETR